MERTRAMRKRSTNAFTLNELMVSMAVVVIIVAVLLTGSIALQRNFNASMQYVRTQTEQVRVLDYISLDLRRALTVSAANGQLSLTIPDYYDANGNPRMPTIADGYAVYGSAANATAVRYYKNGSNIMRSSANKSDVIAQNVQDFQFNFTDLGQVIQVSITFLPTFRQNGNKEEARGGTSASIRTLLRNRRTST